MNELNDLQSVYVNVHTCTLMHVHNFSKNFTKEFILINLDIFLYAM